MQGQTRSEWESEYTPDELQDAVSLYRELISSTDPQVLSDVHRRLSDILPRLTKTERQQYYDLAQQARGELLPESRDCFGSIHRWKTEFKSGDACTCREYYLRQTDKGWEIIIRDPEDES